MIVQVIVVIVGAITLVALIVGSVLAIRRVRERRRLRSHDGVAARARSVSPSKLKTDLQLRPEVLDLLREPPRSKKKLLKKWKRFSEATDDDIDRLYDLVMNCASEIGFADLPDAHVQPETLPYARDRINVAGRRELEGLGRRARGVLVVRCELTARILGAREKHARGPIPYRPITGPTHINRRPDGTEPERRWHRGKDRRLTPTWFKI